VESLEQRLAALEAENARLRSIFKEIKKAADE